MPGLEVCGSSPGGVDQSAAGERSHLFKGFNTTHTNTLTVILLFNLGTDHLLFLQPGFQNIFVIYFRNNNRNRNQIEIIIMMTDTS